MRWGEEGACGKTKGETFTVQASTDGDDWGWGWKEGDPFRARRALMYIQCWGRASRKHQDFITRCRIVGYQKEGANGSKRVREQVLK